MIWISMSKSLNHVEDNQSKAIKRTKDKTVLSTQLQTLKVTYVSLHEDFTLACLRILTMGEGDTYPCS